jgi:hypothetical protein
MISNSLQQGVAYGILTLLVVCITFCVLNVLYNLLLYLLYTRQQNAENARFNSSFV